MTDATTTESVHPADEGRVALGAHCTLRESLELKTLLVDQLAIGRDIELDGRAVERIDTAGLQLLAAFVRELGERHHAIHWAGASPALAGAARQIGLDAALGLDTVAGAQR